MQEAARFSSQNCLHCKVAEKIYFQTFLASTIEQKNNEQNTTKRFVNLEKRNNVDDIIKLTSIFLKTYIYGIGEGCIDL